MKKHILFFSMAFCPLILASIRASSSNISFTETQFYFPLQIGNEWIYYFAESAVTDTIPSTFYFVFDTVSFDRKKYFAYGEDFDYPEYYRSDSLGNIFRNIDGNEILWFDFTKAEGDSYQIDLPSLNLHYHVQVGGRNEIVENRAGKFINCIRLFFDDPYQVDDAFELWFAKDVGIVKRFLPHAIIEQLYSAKVNDKIYPDTVASIKSKGNEAYLKQNRLFQNYPNPFNPDTEIRYQLPETEHIKLEIYNLLGQKIRTLIDGQKPAGSHTIRWDGRDDSGAVVTSGVYLYTLTTGRFCESQKMVLMR